MEDINRDIIREAIIEEIKITVGNAINHGYSEEEIAEIILNVIKGFKKE